MKEKEVVEVGMGEGRKEKGDKRVRAKMQSSDSSAKFSEKRQSKFFIDVSKEEKNIELINNLLNEANDKKFGREINLKDLMLIALPKLTQKDLEVIRGNSLSDTEKMEKECFDYNQKNGTNYEMGYYFVNIRNILKEGK